MTILIIIFKVYYASFKGIKSLHSLKRIFFYVIEVLTNVVSSKGFRPNVVERKIFFFIDMTEHLR